MRIYLDTSVISALFDDRNPERKILTEEFFSEIKTLRGKMKQAIKEFSILEINESVEELAKEYVKYGAVPESYPEDAYHIAVAVLNEMDYLLSWNFRHIVRRRTKDVVRMVNTLRKLKQIEIITPGELL